jgi:hypothetical protein
MDPNQKHLNNMDAIMDFFECQFRDYARKRKEVDAYRKSLPLVKKLLCKLGLHDMKPMGEIYPLANQHTALYRVYECYRCGHKEEK